MATMKRLNALTTEPTRYALARLDDILEMPEPERSFALEEWLADDTPVKIRSASGKPFEYREDGQVKTIPPSGKRVGRYQAVWLLQRYGRKGTYYGVCQATGLTELAWRGLPDTERRRLEPYYRPITDYLTHILDDRVEEEKGDS